jgi:hypothetical protein
MRCGSTELLCAAGYPQCLALLTTHAYDGTRRSECTEDWRDVREQLMQQIESLAANAFGQAVLQVVVRLERNAHVLGAR